MSSTYFNISDKLRLYEFDGMLDQYGDAAAAYSLRKLRNGYTGDAIRVRRSSDDTERDMGFHDNELDTQALLDWVNTEYIRYQSDFRASSPYTKYAANVITSVGESIDGVDDAMKVTLTGGSTNHDICPILNSTAFLGQQVRLEFDYYIPSSNALLDNLYNFNTFSSVTSSTSNLNVLDVWTTVVIEGITKFAPENIDTFIRARAGTSQTFDADGDVFYLKNIRVTQFTADGHVHTWYDQSANANHAVQGTDTAQPKIVDAGSLVTEGGKPGVLFSAPAFMQTTNSVTLKSEDSLISVLFKHDNLSNTNVFDSKTNSKFFLQYNGAYFFDNNIAAYDLSQTAISSRVLATLDFNSTQLKSYFNGANTSTQTVASASHSGLTLGRHRETAINYLVGPMQEFIYWNANNTGNSLAIQENINTHYNIY